MMLPPYDTEEQRALSEQYTRRRRGRALGWTRDEAREYFIAGGGREEEFHGAWERRVAEARREADAIAAGTFHMAGGDILYLVAGRRPSEG